MVDYGNTIEPGISGSVNSNSSIANDGPSLDDAALIGQADLTNGDASTNTLYTIEEDYQARNRFGPDSQLTINVLNALDEGASPVYAVAAGSTSVTGEDLSGLTSNTGTLANAPATEIAADVTFTIGGSALTTTKSFGDVTNLAPATGEVLYNPSNGNFHIDDGVTVGNTGDAVDYDYYDYVAGAQVVEDEIPGVVDIIAPLTENTAVTDDAQDRANRLSTAFDMCVAIIGADSYIGDKTNYTNPYDDSRVSTVYPSRNGDDVSTIGSYAGERANRGISETTINKTLQTQSGKLSEKLSVQERGDLIDNRVVPLEQQSQGARIADDVNTVSDSNNEEANVRFNFTRRVVDYVIKTVQINEQPFIGRLNHQSVRDSFEGLIRNKLKVLKKSNSIIDFDVNVKKVDATTAKLDLSVETAKPIRFIENTVTVGSTR